MFSLPDWLRSKPKQLTEANQKPASELDAEPVAKVIEEAEQVSRDHELVIGQRVSVVFYSDGVGEH